MKHYEKLLEKGCFSRKQLVDIVGTATEANQVFYECYVATDKRFHDFEYDGVLYRRVERKPNMDIVQQGNIWVTSVEQTVVDSIRDFEKIAGIEEVMLRKCAVFYSAIGAAKPPQKFSFDNIGKVSSQQIKRDLNPVLRKGERFDLKSVQKGLWKEQVAIYLLFPISQQKKVVSQHWSQI